MRWLHRSVVLPCLAAACCPLAAAAQVPLPSWAHGARAQNSETPVYLGPDQTGPRRGTLGAGAHLPVLDRVDGHGCPGGLFLKVGQHAYVCERQMELVSRAPADSDPQAAEPMRVEGYAFVRTGGTRAYSHPSDIETDAYFTTYPRRFGVMVRERVTYRGMAFARIRNGLYILERALQPVRVSDFAGKRLPASRAAGRDDAPLAAWVRIEGAVAHRTPRGRMARHLTRLQRVRVSARGPRGTWRLADGSYVDERSLALAWRSQPPASVGEGERWLDVDREQQVLVAYEGRRPVFATLVSTGLRRAQRRTPGGEFRIWVKLRHSDMRGERDRSGLPAYSIEGVPWVQYFHEGYGFHAAFWHEAFGRRRSHGCINLSPRDARWLFDFTRPRLRAGWTAAHPTPSRPGTLVRIR